MILDVSKLSDDLKRLETALHKKKIHKRTSATSFTKGVEIEGAEQSSVIPIEDVLRVSERTGKANFRFVIV